MLFFGLNLEWASEQGAILEARRQHEEIQRILRVAEGRAQRLAREERGQRDALEINLLLAADPILDEIEQQSLMHTLDRGGDFRHSTIRRLDRIRNELAKRIGDFGEPGHESHLRIIDRTQLTKLSRFFAE
jgi:hypothetical protein